MTAPMVPDSVRRQPDAELYAAVGGSALVDPEQTEYWAVCLRTKAKGSFGAHAGAKDTVLLIRGNQVMDAQDGAAGTSFCRENARGRSHCDDWKF